MGRFINADVLVSTGQGILGNNMFAYCGNNPASCIDPTGTAWCKVSFDAFSPFDSSTVPLIGGGGGGIMGSVYMMNKVDSGIGQALDQVESFINNTSESAVLNAEQFAFYKGVLVVKINALDNSGFSFGFIALGPNVDAQTVRHEYGHYVHLKLIGWNNYIFKVALPSLDDYWSDVPYADYYSEPQEYIADLLGGVNRIYRGAPYPYNISAMEAVAYFVYSFIP